MRTFNGIDEKKLKSFYNLSVLQRIDFLKNLGFYDLPVEKRIKYLETIGVFDVDVNLDPPTKVLMPDDPDLDYLKEKPEMQEKYKTVNKWADGFIGDVISSGALKIADVKNTENLNILKNPHQGAIVTMNHFNPFDSFAVEKAIHDAGIDKKLFRVIREGNYTNFPEGPIADYFKYGNTLPLSQNKDTMKIFLTSLKKLLKDGNLVLVCAEQAMWNNYQKPKPMKYGAYRWATEANVPVIPMFVGHTEKDNSSSYTIFMGKPIFSDKNKSLSENTVEMRNQNFEFCKSMYEKYYGKELKYDTQKSMFYNLRGYVRSTPGFEKMIKKERNKDFEDR